MTALAPLVRAQPAPASGRAFLLRAPLRLNDGTWCNLSSFSPVVPAQAGTHIPELVVIGPRFRGDDTRVSGQLADVLQRRKGFDQPAVELREEAGEEGYAGEHEQRAHRPLHMGEMRAKAREEGGERLDREGRDD